MTDLAALARALHVAAVVHWIGGVAMVTLVLLPGLRKSLPASEQYRMFDMIEGRFAYQARISTLLAGTSGLYMTWRLSAWWRFLDPGAWWMHAMVAVWALFSVMLFVAEPLFLHRWFRAQAMARPEATFALAERLHRILLAASLVTIAGAVLGSHGAI